jgi:hypothetical protein
MGAVSQSRRREPAIGGQCPPYKSYAVRTADLRTGAPPLLRKNGAPATCCTRATTNSIMDSAKFLLSGRSRRLKRIVP